MSKIHIDPLDRSGGSGSRTSEEDWLDENSTAADNEWSSASTTFYSWEAPAHRESFFEELYDKHHGKGDSARATELGKKRIMADTRAFCSILELQSSLRERVEHIVERMDVSANASGGKSYEKIILGVISLVHDEYLSSRPINEVQYEQRLIFDDTFRALMESSGIGSKELRGVREHIRSKSAFF